jgi:protease I
MKSLILTWETFQDHEVIYPYYRLQEEGQVDVVANVTGKIFGILGAHVMATKTISDLTTDLIEEYDLLVIPGGVKALEKLRQEQRALDFINNWDSHNKPIASICHGGQMLISSNVIRGRRVSGYYSIKDDLINAGGYYTSDPYVVHDNLICCPHYDHMAAWLKAAIEVCNELRE